MGGWVALDVLLYRKPRQGWLCFAAKPAPEDKDINDSLDRHNRTTRHIRTTTVKQLTTANDTRVQQYSALQSSTHVLLGRTTTPTITKKFSADKTPEEHQTEQNQ